MTYWGRFTVVESISFRIVCQAIAKYAFVTTDLPLIISLEVHCSIEQQKKMVEVLCLPHISSQFPSLQWTSVEIDLARRIR